jgi:hypothetical protein
MLSNELAAELGRLGTEEDMLYHVDVGLPARFQPPKGEFRLRYTHYARRAALEDRYGDLSDLLPAYLNASLAELVETEKDDRGRPTKLVYRVRGTDFLDLVLVVGTAAEPWTVKTLWGNLREDARRTLDRRRYRAPAVGCV